MTSQNEILLHMLKDVAKALGPDLRKKLVFVGGCSTAMFITDEVVLEEVRATDDVDLIVDLAGRAEWMKLQEELRQRGFAESAEEEVICRMRLGPIKVDFMPDNAEILGFTNRWYAKGIDTAVLCDLSEELTIKRLTPELFVATKLEAYLGRGKNDLLGSRDMEDILLVVDGRETLVEEIKSADADVRNYIAEQFGAVIKHPDFENFLAGNIKNSAARVEIVRQRFIEISASANPTN